MSAEEIEQQLALVSRMADAVAAQSLGRIGALLRDWSCPGKRVVLAGWYNDLLFEPAPNFPAKGIPRHGLTAETKELAAAVNDVLEDVCRIFAWSSGGKIPDASLIRLHIAEVRRLRDPKPNQSAETITQPAEAGPKGMKLEEVEKRAKGDPHDHRLYQPS